MSPRIPHHKAAVIVARGLIISESEVPITVLCLLCSPRYTAVRIKNYSKNMSVITVATIKYTVVLRAPIIVKNWSIHCPTLSAMFDSLHSSTNQELFEKCPCNQDSHALWKLQTISITQRKPSCVTTKSMLFTVSKYEMEHKGGYWLVHNICIAHTAVCQKAPLVGWSNIEQWKNQAHSPSCYQVTLV